MNTETKTTKQNKTHTTYGLYLLANQHSGETDLTKIQNNIKTILKDNNGKITNEQRFKKIELSYPIKKSTYAYNAHISFETEAKNIPTINESMKEVSESLIRYMITKEQIIQTKPKKARTATKPKKEEETQPTKTTKSSTKKIPLTDMEENLDNIVKI